MDFTSYFPKVDEAAKWLASRITTKPQINVVLSGGLGDFVNMIEDRTEVSASDIPHFPQAKAEGHSGKVVFGKFQGVGISAMIGRYHYYEGHLPQSIVFPHFVLGKLGVKVLITTNAVGGINTSFKPGDVMMVTDHINYMGINPLIGIATQRKKDQFPNMTNAYDSDLQEISRKAASRIKFNLKEGIYLATSGPSYETKAEIRTFRNFGADAVGMSTVPEVIAANFLGMRVLSYSCIANPAADLHTGIMSHAEVLEAMNNMAPHVVSLLKEVVADVVKSGKGL